MMKNRRYPSSPLLGVGAAVFKNNRVLLIKRGNPPLRGSWSLPGGAIRDTEDLISAVQREIREECRIEVKVRDLVRIFEYIEKDEKGIVKYHYIVFDFKAVYKSGNLNHSSDALEACWVSPKHLGDYSLTDAVMDVIRQGKHI